MIRMCGEKPICSSVFRFLSEDLASLLGLFLIMENMCCLQGSSAFKEYYWTVSFSVLATKQGKRDSARRWLCCG